MKWKQVPEGGRVTERAFLHTFPSEEILLLFEWVSQGLFHRMSTCVSESLSSVMQWRWSNWADGHQLGAGQCLGSAMRGSCHPAAASARCLSLGFMLWLMCAKNRRSVFRRVGDRKGIKWKCKDSGAYNAGLEMRKENTERQENSSTC